MTNQLPAREVPMSELAGNLSALVSAAEAGETLVLTRHGVPVAVLGPVEGEAALAPAIGSIAQESAAAYGRAPSTAAPDAGATALTRLIGAPALRAVMAVFLKDAAVSLHQREIARRAGVGLRSAQIALAKLTSLGLLSAERDGNRLYYQAVRSERFEDLRKLMAREIGVAEVIARYLRASPVPVEQAFIFGSMAEGMDTLSSDIDLLVVSDASADQLVGPIADAQRELGREIDLVHYRIAEFKRRRKEGNHFVQTVLAGPRIDVIGEPDDA